MSALVETPERPTQAMLRRLAREIPPLVASVYLPLPRAERRAAFALLVAHAGEILAERLAEAGLGPQACERWRARLVRAAALPEQRARETKALVLFLDAKHVRCFELRAPVLYGIAVAPSLRLRPLLAALHREGRYRLLEIGADAACLREGDRHGLQGMPPVRVTLPPRARSGARDAALQALARELADGEDTPVVPVASAADATALRAHAVGLPLVPETLTPEGLAGRGAALSERAHALARDAVARAERAACEGLEAARRSGRSAEAPGDVVRSARAGRVRRLSIDAERRVAGHLDRATGVVTGARGDEDVLDALAAVVLASGGEVRVVEGATLGSPTGAAAELAEEPAPAHVEATDSTR